MDVSGWTVDQRMRLPDWCFGNRRIVSVYRSNGAVGTYTYGISETVMPDPACIWQAVFISQPTENGKSRLRIGLSNTLPTSEEEMNAVQEIFPDFGSQMTGPNSIMFYGITYAFYSINLRKGMATEGKKLVISVNCQAGVVRLICALVVSGLPTSMAGWLAHNK